MELQNLKGIGDKTIQLLYKANIYNLGDLLGYYPYRYQIEAPENLSDTKENEVVTINAVLMDIGKVVFVRSNLNVLRLKVEANGMFIFVVIYNRGFLKKNLRLGQDLVITGKYDNKKKTLTASNIKLGKLEEKRIIPIYHSIKGLKSFTLYKIMSEAMKEEENFDDYIPSEYLQKYGFMNKKEAIKIIHMPSNEDSLNLARQRMIYEEFFVFLFKVHYLKLLKNSEQTVAKDIKWELVENFINNLSFALTNDQLEAIKIGYKDFVSKKRMNRLLLGDVGSGKTIVAVVLMYANYLGGFQSAFMAPTEILALQHFHSIKNIMNPYGVKVRLLSGSMSKKERQKVIEEISNNEVDILVGTHAILNEKIKFSNLGFVVTDEQHRFGVNQRNLLQEKGVKPDVMFMSATPIPRTYALTIYGDMDTSIIKEKPSGRKDVITKVKNEKELKEVLYHILEEIKLNHQVYVVAPMINEMEDGDVKNINLLKEKFELAFKGKVPIGVLHGKLKPKEKEIVMNDFKNGNTKILISTTVIEVGVDVALATTIIIFNAERFGLATLHQLRGRVGRNDLQSYCYLICNADVKRLQVLEESNDGFYISEKDYEFRGEGDVFGEKQSGDMTFKIGDLRKDVELLLKVKDDVLEWLKSNDYQKNKNYQKIVNELKFNN